MAKTLLSLLALATLACACSASDPGDSEDIGSTSQPIIQGKPSTDDQDAVVLIVHQSKETKDTSICTGTIVAPNLILTARHCVSETGSGGFRCTKDGKIENDGDGSGEFKKDHPVEELFIVLGKNAPTGGKADAGGRKIFHDGAKNVCGHDIALIQLDRDLATDNVASIRLDSAARKGEKITAVGWGVTEASTKEDGMPSVRQQRAGVTIRQVGPFAGDANDGEVPANDFLVGEATCSGDSGGPGFSEETGAVIGVVSRGGNGDSDPNDPSAGCIGNDTANDYTQTSPFKSLIQTAFRSAGHEPKLENSEDAKKKGCSVGAVGGSSPVNAAAFAGLGVAAFALRRRRRAS